MRVWAFLHIGEHIQQIIKKTIRTVDHFFKCKILIPWSIDDLMKSCHFKAEKKKTKKKNLIQSNRKLKFHLRGDNCMLLAYRPQCTVTLNSN